MQLSKLVQRFSQEQELSVSPRPYTNHAVRFKKFFTSKQRLRKLEEVGYNVFYFPSDMISGCDFLSDSGTTTMTDEQWAALSLGDEAYGSNRGYFLLLATIQKVFGEEFASAPEDRILDTFLFHQGRAAEDSLFGALGKIAINQLILSNGHFDTTAANIEANNLRPVNLFSEALHTPNSEDHFKGNMDIVRLKAQIKQHKQKIPVIFLTITNNTGGGQPVSMENIKTVSQIAHLNNIPFFFDACRFAENAWFIKRFEKGFEDRSIGSIVKEMFSCVDGFSISFKKDGLANIGGGLFLKKNGLFMKKYPKIPDSIMNQQILTEGHPTYGGMSGRDIMTIATGLQTVVREEYLTYRIKQVADFGEHLAQRGLPVISPIGGHAVYLDMNAFFADTAMKPDDFGGISFTALLLGVYGHRACELGYFAFGHYDTEKRKEIRPEINFVRFAIPRLRYEKQDLDNAAEAVGALYAMRDQIPKVSVIYGRDLPLRHFKAKFAFATQQ